MHHEKCIMIHEINSNRNPVIMCVCVCVCQSSDDEDRRLKKREKNRVAAQRSRKRQTQRADLLHETFEYLQRRNSQLRREVDSLSEERRRLSEALRTHEPFCPIMHCSSASSVPLNNAISCLQPASVQ
uniref:Basic leucine zipper transcription factor, ATF-like 3 n=1 Tax=Myripristis murdjan TaxID=586833 RepID=A0A667Y1T7_9TELE